MSSEKIKILIEKYYKAETTLEEEQKLREHFSKKENRNDDPELAELLGFYEQYHDMEVSEEALPIGGGKVKSIAPHRAAYALPWYYSAAAAVIFLAAGVFIGSNWEKDTTDAQQLADLNYELREIKSMISMNQIQSMTASERIQVTHEFREKDSLDTETVNTLISILHIDENVNVRVAATEALAKFKENERIREAFLKALKTETNPVLQIKLIDALMMSRETRAIPEFQRIMQAADQNETVKQRAAYAISQLI